MSAATQQPVMIDNMEVKAGDKIAFVDDDGSKHFGRVFKTQIAEEGENNRPSIDYYCIDNPSLDGFAFGDFEKIENAPSSFSFVETTPKRLFNTNEIDKQEWLVARQRGITGTDISAIMGHNKYKTALNVFRDKTEQAELIEDNNHMKLGRDMEDIVARWFAEETGKKVINQHAVLQHPKYDWMLANIDRKVVGERAIVECKIANEMFTKSEWGESGTDEVPMHYLIQTYHYMIVCGVRTGYLAVIFTDTREFRWYKFELNEQLASYIIKSSYEFYFNHVATGIAPDPVNHEDLEFLYPDDNKPSIVANHEVLELCLQHEKNRAAIKELETLNEQIALKVGLFIGEHRELLVNDEQKKLARFARPKGRNICDIKKLETCYPEAFENCVRQTEPSRKVSMVWQTLSKLVKEAG